MAELMINGKAYPFRLELGGMRLYAIKKGIKKIKTRDIGQMMADADMIEDYPIMIWAGLKAGPRPDQDRFKASIEDVSKWMEEDPAAFDRAIDLIHSDQEGPEPDEEDGKKPTANE